MRKLVGTILSMVIAVLLISVSVSAAETNDSADNRRKFYVERTVGIFENQGDEVRVGVISPQYVTVLRRRDYWLQVRTWLGPKWINIDFAPPLMQSPIDPQRPMIAITFDDGPNIHTERILDVFEAHDARATFFVLGKRLRSFHIEIERMYRNGFEVLGHSWNHPDMTRLSETGIREQITGTHNAIEDIIGSVPQMFRPPFGAFNNTVRRVSAELGFSIISWSVCPMDWDLICADEIARRVLRTVRDGDIVLLHDPHPPTAIAVERIVPELIARGYQLVTVSDLFYYRGITPQAGGVYRRATR